MNRDASLILLWDKFTPASPHHAVATTSCVQARGREGEVAFRALTARPANGKLWVRVGFVCHQSNRETWLPWDRSGVWAVFSVGAIFTKKINKKIIRVSSDKSSLEHSTLDRQNGQTCPLLVKTWRAAMSNNTNSFSTTFYWLFFFGSFKMKSWQLLHVN